MAVLISKKAKHFGYLYRLLSSPQPLFKEALLTQRPLALVQSRFICGGIGTRSSSLNRLNLFSTATPANGSPGNEAPKTEGETKSSGDEGSSGKSNQSGNSKKFRGGPVSWWSFLFLLVTSGGLVYYYEKKKKKHIEDINDVTTRVQHGPSAGKAAIGGPFNLINHEGKKVTEKDFCGNWNLIYFGFTHCPDICPDELVKLAAAIDKIKEKSKIEIVPLFISVDPERDSPEQVGEYVKEFHPKLIGLTGTAEEIRRVARAYRVYYMKTAEEDDDYLVDHSIVMYLMDPGMEFVKFFGKNNDVDELTDGIITEIKNYKKQ